MIWGMLYMVPRKGKRGGEELNCILKKGTGREWTAAAANDCQREPGQNNTGRGGGLKMVE